MNGQDAIEQARRTQPDVMTLDIEMPDMNGLEVLDYMMAQDPLPIIMVSAQTEEGAEVTLQALERGAVDFISKPMNQATSEIGVIEGLLHVKIREAFQARHRLPRIGHTDIQPDRPVRDAFQDLNLQAKPMSFLRPLGERLSNNLGETLNQAEFPLIVIDASTGGPNLLKTVIRNLPSSFPAALLIFQHMPKYFTKVFAENLNAVAAIPIREAQDGDELRAGMGFVAPGNHHVVISRQVDGRPRIRFATDLLEHLYCSSIDCAMVSAVEQSGQSTVALVLTGMGHDGMMGSHKIKEQGGTVLVQDEATSLMYGMPRAVVEAGIADAVIPDVQLARALEQAVDSLCLANK
jgi:two-component system chemotaxis response regulator CheB